MGKVKGRPVCGPAHLWASLGKGSEVASLRPARPALVSVGVEMETGTFDPPPTPDLEASPELACC